MRTLLVYDSAYGSTKQLAEAIATVLGEDAKLVNVSGVRQRDLEDIDLLIVGYRPREEARRSRSKRCSTASRGIGLAGKAVAAFDTRLPTDDANLALQLFLRIIGFAGSRINAALLAKEAWRLQTPRALSSRARRTAAGGELARAEAWAAGLRRPTAVY